MGVLDASAFLRATQGNREVIDALRASRYGRVRLIVPAYFYLEVANGLRSLVVHRRIALDEAHNSLAGALELDAEVESASSLASEALRFALDHGITPYDAGYAVVALRREATLVTADAGLAQAAKKAGVSVTLIVDEAPP